VPHHQWQLRLGQLAVGDVQVGATDTAGAHGDEHLPWARPWIRQLGEPQGLPLPLQDHGAHRLGQNRLQLFFFSGRLDPDLDAIALGSDPIEQVADFIEPSLEFYFAFTAIAADAPNQNLDFGLA